MTVTASTASITSGKAQVRSGRQLSTWDQVGLIVTGVTFVVTILIVLYGLILALGWYSRPFFGAFVYPSGVVIGTRPLSERPWTALQAGVQADDQILRIDNASFADQANFPDLFTQALSTRSVNQTVVVEVFRPLSRLANPMPQNCTQAMDGAHCVFSFNLMAFPFVDFLGFFGLGFLVALIALGLAGWMWRIRRWSGSGRAMILVCLSGAVIFIGRFESTATYQFGSVMLLGLCALAGIILTFALNFPYPLLLLRRQPRIRLLISSLPAIIFGIFALLFPRIDARLQEVAIRLLLVFLASANLILVLTMLWRRQRAISTLAREQASIIFITAIVPLIPMVVWLITNEIERAQGVSGISFSTIYLQPPTILFPLGMAYAILQQRSIDTDRLISDGLVISALGVLVITGYVLVASSAVTLTQGMLQPNNPLLIAGLLFIVVVVFSPVRERMQKLVDEAFFRRRRAYDQRLEQFTRSLTATLQASDVVDLLKNELMATLAPQYAFIFLRNPATGDFESAIDSVTGKPDTDVRFKPDGGLIRVLADAPTVFYLERENIPPSELQSDRARLAVLNTPVIARLRSARRLNGFIALGPSRERGLYRHEDLRFLELAATQAAAAFERVQTILESQRNERELAVLFQVSAALNITMDFDTLLEFIYAQVDKVIKAPNLYIILRDPRTDELYYAFYQEGGDRIDEKEGTRWPMGRDLISEVIRSQQPARTENYQREMQRRDSSNRVENPNLRAWVGVPLNADEGRTLGCIAIGAVDPGITYNDDQTRILWSIADLAATAINKTRLFRETAEMARQMQILNETSGQLATLFEDIDALLQKITVSAVDILNCEAGSLLLVDEETNDLVFRYAVGGTGPQLIGRRIPANSGIAGSVVMTGRHLIVNEASSDPRWYGEMSVSSGTIIGSRTFSTTSILAVPLGARGKVIGVLEVINIRNGVFDDSSVNLLTSFAGQAAIAIENANLFRMTDEALAERVKQLFNMQRIDQELNRTLDLQRVVDLTVDNAIRESNADSGALALLSNDPPSLKIVGSAGYPERVLSPGRMFPLNYGAMGEAYENSQPILRNLEEDDNGAILPGAAMQLCVPLITGETVTGILLLESTMPNAFSAMTAEHIQGLAEHANTAITNARLFAQLGEANNARTKFVGIVAHELKNPMTSIKGYAEGLLSGMVGQLSDRQREFINVIRRNVVRMQQLVDDLRDITAQETGNLKLTMSKVNFNNVVLDAVRPQQRTIDDKNQSVVFRIPDDLPPVRGDENRLIQIMVNFVSNANKYTPEGGTITILAEATENLWDKDGAPEVIHCAITDTGIGMNEDDLRSLFKPYWRSDNPKAQEQTGTGLGMSLTKGLIEAHGGKIWVESELNVGTTFHFTIPLAAEAEAGRR